MSGHTNILKGPNVWVISIEEGKNLINVKRVITENFPEFGKEMLVQIKEAFRTKQTRLKSSFSPHILIKTLNIQNKESRL